MSGGWSAWNVNEAESARDAAQWHVWRAKRVNNRWEYEHARHPRQSFPSAQDLLSHLRSPAAGQPPGGLNANTNQAGGGGPNTVQGITGQLQNTGLGPYSSATGVPTTSQAFANQYSGYRNYGGYAAQRAGTPAPGHPAFGYGGGYQQPYGGGYGGAYGGVAPQAGYGYQGQGMGYPQQPYGGAVRDPRTIGRSATTAPGQVAAQSQPLPNLRHFKVLKPKDHRKFFKAGRVFKAYWTGQDHGSHSFGEVLRFVVLRPHKRHSVCLAIQTYQNQGTAARHIRARDHVIVFTGEEAPGLLPGEDQSLLNRPPIKVYLDPKGEEFKPSSRLSLAKLYTIEHNVPTFPVGKISNRDTERVKQYCIEAQGLFSSAGGKSDAGGESLADVDEEEEEEEEED